MRSISANLPDEGTILITGGNGSLGRAVSQVFNDELCGKRSP